MLKPFKDEENEEILERPRVDEGPKEEIPVLKPQKSGINNKYLEESSILHLEELLSDNQLTKMLNRLEEDLQGQSRVTLINNFKEVFSIWSESINSLSFIIHKHALSHWGCEFQLWLLKLISTDCMSSLIKTKASSLAKINALPVFRSPADLYNEFTLPYDLQKKQIEGEAAYTEGKYISAAQYQLAKSLAGSRKQYRSLL